MKVQFSFKEYDMKVKKWLDHTYAESGLSIDTRVVPDCLG